MGMSAALSATLCFRSREGDLVKDAEWLGVPLDTLRAAVPWRTFRWSKGQKHYSGTYWSATQCDHVIYESRLELARLLFADFDTSVLGIIAQPFLLAVTLDGAARRHVPDFLLLTTTGPVIVDVKPAHRVTATRVAVTFAWTRQVVESRGWRYEVWSEPPTSRLENIRLLAGYRRPWLFDQHLTNALMSEPFDGVSLTDVISRQSRWPEQSVKATVLHLLWKQHFATDLDHPLSRGHLLWTPT